VRQPSQRSSEPSGGKAKRARETREMNRLPAAKTCYIHVGTHKTGTTAIQAFCAANDAALEKAGLLYVRTVRLAADLPGHHNVAFELSGDARFSAQEPKLADALAEIDGSRPPRACLSSEAFEYLHVMPDALRRLRDDLSDIGYRARIIIFLRPQADYIESLYAELVKHGSSIGFRDFLEIIVRDGVFRFADVWTFRFEYPLLIAAFAEAFGEDALTVRAYDAHAKPVKLLEEFLDIAGVGSYAIDPACYESATHANERLASSGVLGLLARNRGASPPAVTVNAEVSCSDGAGDGRPFEPLTADDLVRVTARFAEDDARVSERCRIHLVPVTPERLRRGRRVEGCDPGRRLAERDAVFG
jgi:hypothetical protein